MRARLLIAAALVLTAATACGDDEEAVPVSQAEYDAEAVRLCNQHGEVFDRAFFEARPDSDAEEVAFYRADFIPRARAFVRGLERFGFPADRADDYIAALNDALSFVQQLEDNPQRYLEERRRRIHPPEEDLINRFEAALARADVPCVDPDFE